MSSRAQVQPVNLKERIAALEQRNSASQKQQQQPPSSSAPSYLTPQVTGGALKDRIAKFEQQGAVPVPRGSFGLGAPPTEHGPQRRGELYGNRIPSTGVRPQMTGPLTTNRINPTTTGPTRRSSALYTFSTDTQFSGLEFNENDGSTGGFAPPDESLGAPQELAYSNEWSRPTTPLSPQHTSDGVDRAGSHFQAPELAKRGTAFQNAMERARKAESESQAVYDPRGRESRRASLPLSPQLTPSRTGDLPPPPAIVVSPEASWIEDPETVEEHVQVDSSEQHTSHEKRSEQQPGSQHIETLSTPSPAQETIPSPEPETTPLERTSVSNSASTSIASSEAREVSALEPLSSPGSAIEESTPVQEKLPSPPPPRSQISVAEPSTPPQQAETPVQEKPILDSPSTPKLETLQQPPSPQTPKSSSPIHSSADEDQETEKGTTSPVQSMSPSGVLHDDEDDDADLFVKPIKRDGHRSPLQKPSAPNTPILSSSPPTKGFTQSTNGSSTPSANGAGSGQDLLFPTTPIKDSLPPSPSLGPGQDSRTQSIIVSRPVSMGDTNSPGHLELAHKISTSRGVPMFLPGRSTTPNGVNPTAEKPEEEKEVDDSEFGVVTMGAGTPKSSFSAVVHSRTTSSTLPNRAKTLPSTPKKRSLLPAVEPPMSPGFGELAALMQQSAMLEERLLHDDLPSEHTLKQLKAEPLSKAEGVEEQPDKQEEEDGAGGAKMKRTNTMTSGKSGKSAASLGKKMSLKKAFGRAKSAIEREASLPLEAIPASPREKDMSRSKSMETLPVVTSYEKDVTAAPMPPVPRLELPPPKPSRARSVHTVSAAPEESSSKSSSSPAHPHGPILDSDLGDIPPTPPPKSPSAKYIASFKRLASSGSTSRSHGAYSRQSMYASHSIEPELELELSSDDSVTVATPPDYSFTAPLQVTQLDFASPKTMLETRIRTRSGSRSGERLLVGAGSPTLSGNTEESDGNERGGKEVEVVQWPASSPPISPPRKSSSMSVRSVGKGVGASMGRAASFAEKMWNRKRTKSSASTGSSIDIRDRYSTYVEPLPALPSLVPPSPSLHEMILSEPLSATIPEVNEPLTPTSTHEQASNVPKIVRPPSWLSSSSGGTGSIPPSPLLDKDFFDSFPSVPQTTPLMDPLILTHNRNNTQSTLRSSS